MNFATPEKKIQLTLAHLHSVSDPQFRREMGEMVSVGSTNIDDRSFRLNDEASMNVYDQSFAMRMTEVFERDLACSTHYTYDAWQQRSIEEKILESLV